jgi:Icc protein
MINMKSGRVDMNYNLTNNKNRTVAYNQKTRRPEDTEFQAKENQVPTQMHY